MKNVAHADIRVLGVLTRFRFEKILLILFSAMLPILGVSEGAQQTKIPVVAYLDALSPANASARLKALRQGLQELGYREGENVSLVYRYAEGKPQRLRDLARELVRLRVNVIVTGGPTSTRRAREATAAIPIVMTQSSDPVGNGFVASLARPGGNVTGLSALTSELSGKRIEMLKEVVPDLTRLVVLRTSTSPGTAHEVRETGIAAKRLGLKLQLFDILGPKDIGGALQHAHESRADAILALSSTVLIAQRRRLIALALKHRLPGMYYRREFVEEGGLMSYAPDLLDLSRRAAGYVDKILKGANPADLPVEEPTKFDLVINLKTAGQVGLTIPQSLLYQATKVIR